MLGDVAGVTDGHIDGAIDLVQLISAGLHLEGADQAQEPLGMGRASLSVPPTTIQNCLFYNNPGFNGVPLDRQRALGNAEGGKPEWLGAEGEHFFRRM